MGKKRGRGTSFESFLLRPWETFPGGKRFKRLGQYVVGVEALREGYYFWYSHGRRNITNASRFNSEYDALTAAFRFLTKGPDDEST